MARKRVKRCDQCVALMINGIYCHEIGCPNARPPRDRRLIGYGRFLPSPKR
jgi:hypothetical protein